MYNLKWKSTTVKVCDERDKDIKKRSTMQWNKGKDTLMARVPTPRLLTPEKKRPRIFSAPRKIQETKPIINGIKRTHLSNQVDIQRCLLRGTDFTVIKYARWISMMNKGLWSLLPKIKTATYTWQCVATYSLHQAPVRGIDLLKFY